MKCLITCTYYFLLITVSVFTFDYVSTVISYSLIGIAVFSGKYDALTPADLASAISKVSWSKWTIQTVLT